MREIVRVHGTVGIVTDIIILSICMVHESKTRASEQGRETDPRKQDGTPEVTATAVTRTNERRFLLQTTRATVKNSDGSRSASAKILFDSVSQCLYVTENLRGKLDLKQLLNDTLRLNTFGDNKYKTQKCQVFNLGWILSGPATTIADVENEREVVSNLIISEGIEFDPAMGTMS